MHRIAPGFVVFESRAAARMSSTVHWRGRRAVLVDPGILPDELARIDAFLADQHLTVERVVLTHCHWDHVAGAARYGAVEPPGDLAGGEPGFTGLVGAGRGGDERRGADRGAAADADEVLGRGAGRVRRGREDDGGHRVTIRRGSRTIESWPATDPRRRGRNHSCVAAPQRSPVATPTPTNSATSRVRPAIPSPRLEAA